MWCYACESVISPGILKVILVSQRHPQQNTGTGILEEILGMGAPMAKCWYQHFEGNPWLNGGQPDIWEGGNHGKTLALTNRGNFCHKGHPWYMDGINGKILALAYCM